MFITRKEYSLGGDNKAPGYELFDDYNVRVQLTPVQAQELHQWLSDHAWQIHNDVNGIADEEPPDLTLEHRDRQNDLEEEEI